MISNKERFNKQREAAERQRKRAIEKANSPEFKEKQRKKAIEQSEKRRVRNIAKLNDPAYQQAQKEKKQAQLERSRVRSAQKPVKRKATRGLKGRTALAYESAIQDLIGSLPCIACMRHARTNEVVSLHHIDGRTKDHAHAMVLPLCAEHHNVAAPVEMRSKYSDLIPLHAQGSAGGKRTWERINGTQLELLSVCFRLKGIESPFDLEPPSPQLLELFGFDS